MSLARFALAAAAAGVFGALASPADAQTLQRKDLSMDGALAIASTAIADCKSNVIITADEGVRGGRKVPLKSNADDAIAKVGGRNRIDTIRIARNAGWI